MAKEMMVLGGVERLRVWPGKRRKEVEEEGLEWRRQEDEEWGWRACEHMLHSR